MTTTSLKPTVSPLQLRDELETIVLKELLGPGSAEEEVIESPATRYFVGVLAPRKKAKAGAAPAKAAVAPPLTADADKEGGGDEILDGDELALGGTDTTQDGTTDQTAFRHFHFRVICFVPRCRIPNSPRWVVHREVLAQLLKLNHERYAEEVKQGLHEKKKPKGPKKTKRAEPDDGPTLFE